MHRKTWKIWSVVFVSAVLYPYQELESCAGGDEDYWVYSRFFNPELTQQPAYKPLYFSFDRLYDESWEEDKNFRRGENLRDWVQSFENQPKPTDVDQLVYTASKKDILAIKAYVQNTASPLRASLQNNSLIKYLVQKKDLATLDYLAFAKTCEPLAIEGNTWEEGNVTTNKPMTDLSTKAEAAYATAPTPFLKLRYAYQAVRMAHYAGNYARAISLYDKLVTPLTLESPIKYWALGHKAGAIRRLGKNNALAAYLFAVVFEKSESKRINSYYSFHISSDNEWKTVFAMCKTNREKSTLYFLRAIQPENLKLEEMKNIYALDPASNYLDILLVREINKYEVKKALQTEDLASFKNGSANLKAFIFKALSDGKISNKPLWTLALGYCDYLAGKPQEARKTFAQLPATSQTPEVKKQIDTFELMIQMAELQKLDAATEERLYRAIMETKSESLKGLMVSMFAGLYKKQGEEAKAYLSENELYHLRTSPEAKRIDQLIAFADKSSKTSYEKELLRKIHSSQAKEVLLEMKATLLLRADKLDEAEQILSRLAYKYEDIEGNPTDDRLKDCHECYEGVPNHFSKLQLIQQIKNLKKQAAEPDKTRAAEATYQLGNIYYNTTYFGFAWRAMDYFRPYGFQKPDANQTDEHYDCSRALTYFTQAADLFKQLNNKEKAARALFLAAKCEQNAYYIRKSQTDPADTYYFEGIAPNYEPANRKYFTQLKQQYAQTQFYTKARQECFYLNQFAK